MNNTTDTRWIPTLQEFDDLKGAIEDHKRGGTLDRQISDRIIAVMEGPEDFRNWFADLNRNLPKSPIRSFAFYAVSAEAWPKRRAAVSAKQSHALASVSSLPTAAERRRIDDELEVSDQIARQERLDADPAYQKSLIVERAFEAGAFPTLDNGWTNRRNAFNKWWGLAIRAHIENERLSARVIDISYADAAKDLVIASIIAGGSTFESLQRQERLAAMAHPGWAGLFAGGGTIAHLLQIAEDVERSR